MTHEPGIVSNERQRLYLLAIFNVDQLRFVNDSDMTGQVTPVPNPRRCVRCPNAASVTHARLQWP